MASLTIACTAPKTAGIHGVCSQFKLRNSSESCQGFTRPVSSFHDLKARVAGLVAPPSLSPCRLTTLKKASTRQTRRTLGAVAEVSTAAKLTWQELHGSKDWAGLVEKTPLHPELVKEIIKYGELVQATYDGFIPDPPKKKDDKAKGKKDNKVIVEKEEDDHGGKNMYTRAQLLDKSLPADSLARKEGYKVHKYMHSSSGLASLYGKDSLIYKLLGNKKEREVWAGYVGYKVIDPAAKIPEIEIVVAFRGTILLQEWVSNAAGDAQNPWLGFGTAKVHNGFQQIYRDDGDLEDASDKTLAKYTVDDRAVAEGSPQDEVHKSIAELASKYKVRNIVSVGHSLGAALATICALDLGQFVVEDPVGKKCFPDAASRPSVSAFVFASPRVGNQEFRDLFNQYNVKVFRTTDVPDIVPQVPGVLEYDEKDAVKDGFWNNLKNSAVKWIDDRNVLADWVEVGMEVKVDYRKSKILTTKGANTAQLLGRYHNNEVHLYLIATQLGGQPEPTVGKEPGPGERHYRLCNKSDNTLIPEFSSMLKNPIPPNWWATRPDRGDCIPSSDPEER
eukprot:TRINITY_DN468_c0_g1_i1.p1 TRINITY_DN468_c0_g1~~TRINITY_DN468_c0_g1_i1.p1  ORF type:complete len:561 (-),score=122.62 TRINITY_DN468_c0_g1_i1:269-1951(-)